MRRDAGSVKPRCEGFPASPIAASTVTPRYGTTVAAAWGPSAPVAHHPRDLARSSRRPAGHRGGPDPATGRAPARRRDPSRCGCGITHRCRAGRSRDSKNRHPAPRHDVKDDEESPDVRGATQRCRWLVTSPTAARVHIASVVRNSMSPIALPTWTLRRRGRLSVQEPERPTSIGGRLARYG